MFSAEQVKELKEKGYLHLSSELSSNLLDQIEGTLSEMSEKDYSVENLSTNAVYISDSSPTRVSHAMMMSINGSSPFPEVMVRSDSIRAVLGLYRSLVAVSTGVQDPENSRIMFNFQRYMAGSKPVAEHYDGHYLSYEKTSPTSFRLKRGLLPRYVMVVTLRNSNTDGDVGTILREVSTGGIIQPPSGRGDVLIFDNIRFRHSVPELAKSRLMVGARCFDSQAVLFEAEKPEDGHEWVELPDASSPGFIRPVTDLEAAQILADYYANVWPEHWKTIQSEGAVF